LAPAIITPGAGSTPGVAGAPDTIAVAYGNADSLPAPVTILISSLGVSDDFIKTVNALYGFQPGEHVVIAESGKPCTLAQVNLIPPATGDNTRLDLMAGTYVNPYTGATLNTRYNNPAGLGTAYTPNGKVYNIGNTTNKVFSVQNGQLMVQAIGAAASPIYDNIVQLQAQYGKDLTNDGMVDVFDETTPASSAEWAAVLAIRIAVVARSGLFEKDEVSPATIRLWENSVNPPTTTGPVWTLTADERHYRYKVFQTVVPLRNMLWRPY
jgi:type IV pilus assembly protein PilW